jgi:acyl-CoA dehydrogenase
MGLVETARSISADVVAAYAADVDREARMPIEAVEALRKAQLLSCLVSRPEGGFGSGLAEVARATQEVATVCASTAMIFAMHQIQVACLVRHGDTPALIEMRRRLVDEQLLFASATTEVGIGGDVRSSACALERDGDRFRITKQAPVISYGAYADAIFTTARATADSPANDQIMAVCLADELELEPTGTWDTLGFRGTCSPGFVLRAQGDAGLVFSVPYGDMSAATMLPTAHVLWSHVWLGIADTAVRLAHQFVRSAARARPGSMPPAAPRLVELVGLHRQFTELVYGTTQRYVQVADQPDSLSSVGFAVAMNSLKVSASSMVIDIVTRALLIVGIAGYRDQGTYAMGRLVRDAYGASLMVNNDRIIGNSAQLLLVAKDLV